jgi:hypothetical protein
MQMLLIVTALRASFGGVSDLASVRHHRLRSNASATRLMTASSRVSPTTHGTFCTLFYRQQKMNTIIFVNDATTFNFLLRLVPSVTMASSNECSTKTLVVSTNFSRKLFFLLHHLSTNA